MAVDKLVDSTQLDSDLTSVANAIRAKGGTSAQLAFPAGFVSAISDIPSGGSLPTLLDKVDAGTATIVTAADNIQVSHNLGKVPDFAAIYQDLDDGADIAYGTCVMCTYLRIRYSNTNQAKNNYLQGYAYKHATSGNLLTGTSSSLAANATTTTYKFARGSQSWSPVDANNNPVTYKWVVGTFKEDA